MRSHFDLDRDSAQTWELGVKEVWEVPTPLRKVIHTLGWPLRFAAEVPRVRRLVDLPDGRRQDLPRLRGRAGLRRREPLVPRRAPAVQDPPVHLGDPEGRQAARLGRQDHPRRRPLRPAEPLPRPGCGPGGRQRRLRGHDGAEGRPPRHPLRDAGGRGHLRGAEGRQGHHHRGALGLQRPPSATRPSGRSCGRSGTSGPPSSATSSTAASSTGWRPRRSATPPASG